MMPDTQSDKDVTVYDMQGDTRKSRLTLEMLNQLRHAHAGQT
jgi:hypothetical protein